MKRYRKAVSIAQRQGFIPRKLWNKASWQRDSGEPVDIVEISRPIQAQGIYVSNRYFHTGQFRQPFRLFSLQNRPVSKLFSCFKFCTKKVWKRVGLLVGFTLDFWLDSRWKRVGFAPSVCHLCIPHKKKQPRLNFVHEISCTKLLRWVILLHMAISCMKNHARNFVRWQFGLFMSARRRRRRARWGRRPSARCASGQQLWHPLCRRRGQSR